MKVPSARFVVIIMLVSTACVGFIRGLVPIGVFAPMVLLGLDWYFKRRRKEEE